MNPQNKERLGGSKPFNTAGAIRKDLIGKTYVNWLRCSNLTQVDTSPAGQKRTNDAFASLHGMNWMDDVSAEGVSGSQTFNRSDIDELLALHKTTPFDVALVHDLSRMTRGGIRHGNVVEDTFRKAGILLVSTTDLIPEGPEGDLIKSVKHYSNQLQARSISLGVARGLSQSLAKNLRPGASRTPYALDRLYMGPNDNPRMLVRWDGRVQLWLKPDTLEKIAERVKPVPLKDAKGKRIKSRGQRFKGYMKQTDETSRLIPGSAERRESLEWIFNAYDGWKWGYHRIVQNLNDRQVPSPDGCQWVLKSVRSILFNPIYLGVEVRHRWTGSLYNMLTESGTSPVFIDQDALEREKRTCVPHVERPREDWHLVDVEQLKDLLPSPLRELAAERIMRQLDPNVLPHPKKGKPIHTGAAKHKHLDSPFLLTNLLHSKQTKHAMRGEVANRKLLNSRKIYRYYFDGGAAIRGEKGLHIKRIPAEPVEQAVMGVLEEVLNDSSWVQERIHSAAIEQAEDQPNRDAERNELLTEQQAISARLRQVYKLLGRSGSEAVEQEVEADYKRLEEIKRQLARVSQPTHTVNIDVAARNVTDRIRHLRESLDAFSNAELKQLLAAMIDDLQIDLANGDLSFTMVLPSWLTNPLKNSDEPVRLDYQLPWPWVAETNQTAAWGERIRVAEWLCHSSSKKCYECTRHSRAA